MRRLIRVCTVSHHISSSCYIHPNQYIAKLTCSNFRKSIVRRKDVPIRSIITVNVFKLNNFWCITTVIILAYNSLGSRIIKYMPVHYFLSLWNIRYMIKWGSDLSKVLYISSAARLINRIFLWGTVCLLLRIRIEQNLSAFDRDRPSSEI